MIYLYIIQDVYGRVHNHYWDRKTIDGIEAVIHQHSTRKPSSRAGWTTSNKDAVILNIIEVGR